jgi:hypothetical protein
MLINEDQSCLRINSEDNLANLLKNRRALITPAERRSGPASAALEVRPAQNQGARTGDKRIPGFLREVIAATAQHDTTRSTASAFNISQTQAVNLGNGRPGSHSPEDPALQTAIDKTLGQVRDSAINKLMGALGCIDKEKLEKSNARDLSTIASNMSKIVVSTIPTQKQDEKPRIIVYAPEISQVNNYQVVEID